MEICEFRDRMESIYNEVLRLKREAHSEEWCDAVVEDGLDQIERVLFDFAYRLDNEKI